MNVRIKTLREASGISQSDLASSLRVTRQAVYNWEAGHNQPSLQALKEMAGILGVSVDALLADGSASASSVQP